MKGRVVHRAVGFVVIALAAAACDGGASTAAGGSPAPGESPGPASGRRAALVAYASGDDVWVYDVAADRTRQVTADEDMQRDPRFVDADTVSFAQVPPREAGPTLLVEQDLDGSARTLLSTDGKIASHDWSPDGRTAAVLATGMDDRAHVLVWSRGEGREREIRDLGPLQGREILAGADEFRVSWSPDGALILVVETGIYAPDDDQTGPSLYVLRPDGSDAVEPRDGTFARWAPDSRTVLFRRGAQWRALDVATGEEQRLEGADGLAELPDVSPAGRFLAADSGSDEEDPSVLVYDREGSSARTVAEGVAPLWISEEELLVTEVRPCGGGDECVHAPAWRPTGRALRVSLGGGDPEPVALTRTVDDYAMWTADVWFSG